MTDAYLVAGVRTPIGRYGGALSAVRPDDLAAHVIRELLTRVDAVDGATIDEVILGCANQAGEDNRNVARMAVLLSGLPESFPATTVNPCPTRRALGHPLGMSGARLILTAALELRERAAHRALATMCVGVGQGIATALEAP